MYGDNSTLDLTVSQYSNQVWMAMVKCKTSGMLDGLTQPGLSPGYKFGPASQILDIREIFPYRIHPWQCFQGPPVMANSQISK